MKRMAILLLALILLAMVAVAQATDPRYCGVMRDETGKIIRSSAVVREFKALHACPSTSLHTGACPGWAVDHVVPLVCGGCDAVVNMQWLPLPIKSASGIYPKDRWEQRVYCTVAP